MSAQVNNNKTAITSHVKHQDLINVNPVDPIENGAFEGLGLLPTPAPSGTPAILNPTIAPNGMPVIIEPIEPTPTPTMAPNPTMNPTEVEQVAANRNIQRE
jgi:hypothetical protein